MTGRLSEDPVFAAGFGPATVQFEWVHDAFGGYSRLKVPGPAGLLTVQVSEEGPTPWHPAQTSLTLRIHPTSRVCEALGCGSVYAAATPVKGTTADLSGFIVAAEDLLAEFLADIVVSPSAYKLLPDLPRGNGGC